MKRKYPQPDGRGVAPRKWSADKNGGPLIYFAERVLKRLIQHGWPASYRVTPTNYLHPIEVTFFLPDGDTPEFFDALRLIVQITERAFKVPALLVAGVLRLIGAWVLVLRHPRFPDGREDRTKVVGADIRPAPDCPF